MREYYENPDINTKIRLKLVKGLETLNLNLLSLRQLRTYDVDSTDEVKKAADKLKELKEIIVDHREIFSDSEIAESTDLLNQAEAQLSELGSDM
jgi:3-dehydroquinate dehydratase